MIFQIFSIILSIIAAVPSISYAIDYNINHNPQSYVLNKLQTHEIVFLGTRHKQPPILELIANLIRKLHESGVTHIGLEIESDQQAQIDRYMKTGNRLSDIEIHPQIDCPEYRNLFKVLRALEPKKRPTPIALDLPKSKYGENISRDESMADSISNVFKSNTNAKMLVVLGNLHIFKKLEWRDKVVNKHRSIREYLSEKRSILRIFSVGLVIGESLYEDDFAERFGPIEGAVALDLDERYAGWKLSSAQTQAIQPAEVWELLDGVVVY